MAITESSATAPHTRREATEEHPCACYGGLVFIGHLVEDPEACEEVEAFEAVPCRACAGDGR